MTDSDVDAARTSGLSCSPSSTSDRELMTGPSLHRAAAALQGPPAQVRSILKDDRALENYLINRPREAVLRARQRDERAGPT